MPSNSLSPQNPTLFFHGLRISLGVIYFYFGFLKFLPGASPAEALAGDTISRLMFDAITPATAVMLLAILECGMGLLFLSNRWSKMTYFLFLGHMLGTFTPMFLLPHLTFNQTVLLPTLEGQYILKNIVFLVGVSAIYLPQLYPQVRWDELSLSAQWTDRADAVELAGPGAERLEGCELMARLDDRRGS